MSIEDAIQAMYEYDLVCSSIAARSYITNHNARKSAAADPLSRAKEAYSPLMNKYQEAISITDTLP